ncbi:hypothetical protein GUJ93_ZPchr0011g27443 [Zizania palustris]|uniref:Uncharacterized protein n=1 Tax=Zizania palustris TaxID=103762 RepID=A0A8J5WGX2_ZIZPA|nr:hypothetical protein GUJ93_ZPchr0011g27443 [Zizania palustris]
MGSSGSSWVVEMDNMIDFTELPQQRAGHSIYRVPEYIKNITNRNAYRPQLVSLGPFHHGDPVLLPMEAHKRRAVVQLVKRSGKPLRELIAAVDGIHDQLHDAYENLDETWHRERFVELMVTDGCFFLEVMRIFRRKGIADEEDYGPDDPIFSEHGYLYLRDDIISDVLLIENQLPLLLLQTLMFLTSDPTSFEVYLNYSYIWSTNFDSPQNYFSEEAEEAQSRSREWESKEREYEVIPNISLTKETPLSPLLSPQTIDGQVNNQVHTFLDINLLTTASPIDDHMGLHPLDILQKSVSGKCQHYQESTLEYAMHTASKLHEAGIHFKVSDSYGFAGAVSFKSGVLSIPKIFFHGITESMVLNLMAFEKLHPGIGNDVTAFMYFIDTLIDTPKDVALLRSKGIINSILGSDKEVANLINNTLSKGAVLSRGSSLEKVLEDMDAHCKELSNEWRATFMHTYLSNPWVFISLIAASILLFSTVMQTAYAAMSFYQKK